MFFAPFRGTLFDPARVPDVGSATCPPYDVIDESDRLRYRASCTYNVVRLLLAGPGDASYQEAAELLQRWRRDGTLVTDPDPLFYLYRMEYHDDHGEIRTATGVIGALSVLPLGERVLPHEETMPRTRADRLTVMRAIRANLDLIVGLSPGEELPALLEPAGPPRLSFESEGVRHALFDVRDPALIGDISAAVGSAPVAIADGHHRYTSAFEYRREQSETGPWDSIMAYVVPAVGSGLTVGPTHRFFTEAAVALDRLARHFEVSETAAEVPSEPGDVVLVTGASHGFGPLLLTPRPELLARLPEPWREASPAVGRELLYPLMDVAEERAGYVADLEPAIRKLAEFPEGAVALMAPLSEHSIAVATQEGLRFPQKSTYFRPKPRSGLVIRCFEGA